MGTSRKLYSVAGSEHGIVLLDFLAKRLAISNKSAKRLLDSRSVFVNNRRIWMARHILIAGDHVEVLAEQAQATPTLAMAILHDDADYLVIDKPAGLLANGPQSAESLLRAKLHRDVYAVHRLDRETSGCLMLAKSVAARDAMRPLFQAGAIKKIYHALVLGRVARASQTINEPIDNQPAVTRARVLKASDAATFLEISIETGRTHQIRKHLASIRHPVIGDKTYANVAVNAPALRNVSRQMLHASRLAFKHPQTGAAVDVTAALPRDFKACQASLRLLAPRSTPAAAVDTP